MLYYYNIFIIFDIGWSVPGGQYNRRISTSQILGGNLRRAITTTRCCAASLKTTRFCRNMYPLLRRAVLKQLHPLSVELRIHSTSSSSSSNGGMLQTTLTLCFLVKFSFVSNIDDTSSSTNQFHHFSFI